MSGQPYKVCAFEVGGASVYDRATGKRIGYVLNDFYGRWHAHMADTTELLPVHRYRTDAAKAVWERHEFLRGALA